MGRDTPAAVDRITALPSYRPAQVAKMPPCQAECAVAGDVRGWIGVVAQRRLTGLDDDTALTRAWEKLVETNPFPASLGRICPHPCELGCNRNDKDEPIAISELERFIGDWGLDRSLPLPRLETSGPPRSVGVVGAGPAGLSFAYQMARRGHDVTLYEREPSPGGMLRFGIPDYRLPPAVLSAEIDRILELGVRLADADVGRSTELDELRARHEALFMAVGAQAARRLDVPGEDLPGVHLGIQYLGTVNRGGRVDLGATVAVIGGGNTAIDAARTARRTGADVTVYYRRTREEMPAADAEIQEALEEGIEIRFLRTPIEIVGSGSGGVRAIRLQEVQLGDPDESGRRRPEPVAGSVEEVASESVIVAVAQVVEPGPIDLTALRGVDGPTQIEPGLWVGGDLVDPTIAGAAIRHGREVAEAVHAELTGEAAPQQSFESPISSDRIGFHNRPVAGMATAPRVPPADSLAHPDREVATGISEEQFFAEIERCFSCGLCFGCGQCFMYCTVGGFVMDPDPSPGQYFTLYLTNCTECGKCVEVCPCGYLEASPSPVGS